MLGPTGSQKNHLEGLFNKQWAPPTESAFLTSSQVMLPTGPGPHFEKLLPTYEILVTLLSSVGELGMHFHGAAGLSYGTTGPHRVGLVLSPMAEVICFGLWAQR